MNIDTRTQRFMRRMSWFWTAYNYLFLVVITGATLLSRPDLRGGWGGLALGATTLAYAGVYWFGYRWLALPDMTIYWLPPAARDPRRSRRAQARRATYWALVMLATAALVRVDANYAGMFWASFGLSLSLFRWPWNVPFAVAPIVIVLALWHVFPTGGSPQSWLNFGVIALSVAGYIAVCVIMTLLITERYHRERLVRELQTTQAELSAASQRLAETADQDRELAVLRERERLARELHDTLGHALVLTTVKLEAIHRLMSVDAARASHEITSAQAVTREAMTDLRAALSELRSPIARGAPVGFTLARLARECGARAGWNVDCAIGDATGDWPPAIQDAFLRVGAEALANAERHARARHVHLTVTTEGDHCALLLVRDDGVGLPPPLSPAAAMVASPPGHFGLSGMRERLVALDGALTIASSPGEGVSVTARAPLLPSRSLAPARVGEERAR